MVSNLARVCEGMWNENCVVAPSSFKQILGVKHPEFQGFRQHDSQEAFNRIVNDLHDEICRKVIPKFKNIDPRIINLLKVKARCDEIRYDKKRTVVEKKRVQQFYKNYLKENPDASLILQSYIYWKNTLKTEGHSIITELFSGIYHSSITCTECNYCSHSFEKFIDFQLEIPLNRDVELIECLESFSDPEEMSRKDGWKCADCKKAVDAVKMIEIWEAPKILVIHLKRFHKMNQYHSRKISTKVDFPLKGLEFNQYLAEQNVKGDYVYDLYAVSNHVGSVGGGHYFSYCKNSVNGRWYRFDDRSVTHIPKEDVKKTVVSDDAYLLFYKLREL
jgi:ubiquitin C-terminal hydrolase